MTTRAFLKTAEKKRDSLQAKEATPLTPVEAKPTATPSTADQAAPPSESAVDGNSATTPAQQQEQAVVANGATADNQIAELVSAEEGQDGAPSTENQVCFGVESYPILLDHTNRNQAVPFDDQAVGDQENQDKKVDSRDGSKEENGDAEAAIEESNEGDDNDNMENQQKSSFPNSFGFGGMNGQFPNMNFGGGDFNQMNQMQMMMAMQNGMAPNGFGFPMMGKYAIVSATRSNQG